jgi:hypothetical protein
LPRCSKTAAFRLKRHHLLRQGHADLAAVATSLCGIQSQSMTAARISLWTRIPQVKRTDIDKALLEDRVIVRTSCMRQTLHIIPRVQFPVYIAALRSSRTQAFMRVAARFGITQSQLDAFNEATLGHLGKGPSTRRELIEIIYPTQPKNVKEWMDKVWSPFRLAIVEGLICYGPDTAGEPSFVRVDKWLQSHQEVGAPTAKQILLRQYLSAYGPADPRDFSKWSGMTRKEVNEVWLGVRDELVEIDIDGRKASILRQDYEEFNSPDLTQKVLRLLPSFDSYLLAHADKAHLINPEHYKRVYRDQWWISAVILLNGTVTGTWNYSAKGGRLAITIEPFEKLARTIRRQIGEEAEGVAGFLGMPYHVEYR